MIYKCKGLSLGRSSAYDRRKRRKRAKNLFNIRNGKIVINCIHAVLTASNNIFKSLWFFFFLGTCFFSLLFCIRRLERVGDTFFY